MHHRARAARRGRISMALPYRALWSYIRYTLYFIAYTRLSFPPPSPLSLSPSAFFTHAAPTARFLLAARRAVACRRRTPSADIMPPAYSLRFRPRLLRLGRTLALPLLRLFSIFLSSPPPALCSLSFLPRYRAVRGRFSLVSAARPPPTRRRRNIFPEHYFYRPDRRSYVR